MSIRKNEIILLILIAALGIFLRLLFLPSGGLTFGYDQARDAFSALEIAGGNLKIQGPSASTPGLFHGVLYYYLLAPAYFFGSGSPYIAGVWVAILNILTIIPIFLLGKLLFSPKVGFLASFLFAISFDAVQYGLWMSNPTPAVLSGAIFYLGLAYYIFSQKKTLGVVLAAIGLGFSTQFEVFLGYLFVPLIISLVVFKIKPTVRHYLIFAGVYLLSISSMILSYVKFGPTFIQGFANLFNASGGDPFGNWRQFSPTLELYLNRFVEYFYRGVLPFNIGLAGIIAFIITVTTISWAKKESGKKPFTYLLILLFSHVFLILFGGTSTPFINAGLQAAVLVLIAAFLSIVYQKQKLAIILLSLFIIFSCTYATLKYNSSGQTVFSIQRGLTLKNELAAIDYTYQVGGNHFSINTVTSPLWINTVWAYLYNWYGQDKYGFVPSYHGRDQNGYLGSMPEVSNNDQILFLIIEPLSGIPQEFVDATVGYENTYSKVVEEKNYEGIVVQKRILTKPFNQINFIK
ncbi:MAG: hypothetical protein Q7R49_04865 [Candidatus Daviesbacteria bacterium]|nr:hypothetical protein [Candidatus Daviesbacteria bacterium]